MEYYYFILIAQFIKECSETCHLSIFVHFKSSLDNGHYLEILIEINKSK